MAETLKIQIHIYSLADCIGDIRHVAASDSSSDIVIGGIDSQGKYQQFESEGYHLPIVLQHFHPISLHQWAEQYGMKAESADHEVAFKCNLEPNYNFKGYTLVPEKIGSTIIRYQLYKDGKSVNNEYYYTNNIQDIVNEHIALTIPIEYKGWTIVPNSQPGYYSIMKDGKFCDNAPSKDIEALKKIIDRAARI